LKRVDFPTFGRPTIPAESIRARRVAADPDHAMAL